MENEKVQDDKVKADDEISTEDLDKVAGGTEMKFITNPLVIAAKK